MRVSRAILGEPRPGVNSGADPGGEVSNWSGPLLPFGESLNFIKRGENVGCMQVRECTAFLIVFNNYLDSPFP